MRAVEAFLYRRLLMSGSRDVQMSGKRGKKNSKMTSLAPFLQSLIREEKNVLVRNISKFIIYL